MITTTILNFSFLYVATNWVIRVLMFIIIPYRRSASGAYAWLLLVLIFPIGGLILYLLIGSPKLSSTRRLQQKIIDQSISEGINRLQEVPQFENILEPPVVDRYKSIIVLNERLGGLPICGGNSCELLTDYYDTVDRIVSDIDTASDYVHMEYYVFSLDDTGMKVIDALERATKRGVVCRVLADHVGNIFHMNKLLYVLHSRGIEAYRMLPIDVMDNEWSRIDLRNHRKIVVIDGKIGYTGSQNIINSTYNDKKDDTSGLRYEELVIRVTGPVVVELLSIFMADWYSETKKPYREENYPELLITPELSGNVAAQVLPSGPGQDTENNKLLFVSLIHQAREKVVIVTPYFIPDQSLLDALNIAAHRGVDVRLIVSGVGDQFVVEHAQRSYYSELLESGVHIHLYNPPILLHSKTVRIDDDIAVIGSSNMDIRSFYLDLEVSMMIYDSNTVLDLKRIESGYFARSQELDLLTWEKRPFLTKVIENTTRMMSDVI